MAGTEEVKKTERRLAKDSGVWSLSFLFVLRKRQVQPPYPANILRLRLTEQRPPRMVQVSASMFFGAGAVGAFFFGGEGQVEHAVPVRSRLASLMARSRSGNAHNGASCNKINLTKIQILYI